MTLSCRSECCTQIHVPVKRGGRHEHPQLQHSPPLRSDSDPPPSLNLWVYLANPRGLCSQGVFGRPACGRSIDPLVCRWTFCCVVMVPEPYEACQRSARSNDSTINDCGPLTCSRLHWEMMKRTHTHKHNASPSVYAHGLSLMVDSFAFYQTKCLQLLSTVMSVTICAFCVLQSLLLASVFV